MDTFREVIQKRNLANLIKFGCLEVDKIFYPYTSGKIGSYFLQSVNITKDGMAYHQAIQDISDLIIREVGLDSFDVISGGESRDYDFSNPVAYNLFFPHVKLYKKKSPIGADIKGKRVLHVADLNNKGSSVENNWFPQINEGGGIMDSIVFYVDRMEEGVKVVEDLGLKRLAVVSLDSKAWQFLYDQNLISERIYASINRSLDDQNWEVDTLRANIGGLKEIIENPITYEKGMKILNQGYPEIREELVERLAKIGCSVSFRK